MTNEAYLELTVVLSSPTPTPLSLHFAHSSHGFLSILIHQLISYFRELHHDLLSLGISFLPPLHLLSWCQPSSSWVGYQIPGKLFLPGTHWSVLSYVLPNTCLVTLLNRHHPDSLIHSTRARTMLVLLLTISFAFSIETTKSIPTKCWWNDIRGPCHFWASWPVSVWVCELWNISDFLDTLMKSRKGGPWYCHSTKGIGPWRNCPRNHLGIDP